MAQFEAFDPEVEVNGETVLSVIDGMGTYKSIGEKILQENGIVNPQPGEWYSQQAWLNAFRTIAEKVGDSTLYEIGKKIPENAQFPPEVDSTEKGLGVIDVAYHMNHRNGRIGNYRFEKTGPRSGRMKCDNPYPTEFDRGIIEAMGSRFGDVLDIELDPSNISRSAGGNMDVYIIQW
jgi:hypothetical protein